MPPNKHRGNKPLPLRPTVGTDHSAIVPDRPASPAVRAVGADYSAIHLDKVATPDRRRRSFPLSPCAGMTLVEVSVVLMILAFALGAAMMLANARLEAAKVSSTKEKQQAIKVALQNFIARQNRLPCPAVPTAAQGTAAYGAEAANPGTCTSVPNFTVGGAANRNARGVVPWVALGLPDDAAIDGFGNRFTYQVLRSQTNLNAATVTGMTGNIAVYDRRPAAGGNQVNANALSVAAVISHGKNGWGAYLPITGTQLTANGGDPDEDENTDNDLQLVDRAFSDATNDGFDDIVTWLAPEDLLRDLQSSGALLSANAEAAERLAAVKSALITYLAGDSADPDGGGARVVRRALPFADRATGVAGCGGSADNGVWDNNCLNGSAPWSTLGLTAAQSTDPWGNYIRYSVDSGLADRNNVTGASATRGLRLSAPAANNTAFTITASGADDAFGTADDIAITMKVWELRDLANQTGISYDN